jgi:ATP synthase F0 subunit b
MDLLIPSTGLLFWMCVTFFIVLALLWKFGFPAIVTMVNERKQFIDDSLKKAQEANERLANIQKEGETILREAREKQVQLLKEATDTRDAIVSKAQDKAKEEASRLLADAKAQIDAEKAGKYREVKVYISGSRYAVSAVSKIPAEMQKLVKWYNENEKRLHPVELAATLHQRFVFIHPFVDGNGRVARLLMNLALLRNGFTIAIIPAVLRHEYIYSLEAAHTRPEVFIDFIADRVIATQLDLLRLMREDDDTVNDTVNDTVKAVAPQLSKTEQTVLNAISTYPNYSYEKLATYCQLSRPTIARTIKALQSREFIRRIGSDKTGHWEVIGKEDEA